MAYRLCTISQAEAEELIGGLPGPEMETTLASLRRGQPFVVRDDVWALLQEQAPDTKPEHRAALSSQLGVKLARAMVQSEGLCRDNVALLVNKTFKYIIAVAPVYKDGVLQVNTFRPIAAEIVKQLFSWTPGRRRDALACNNIETVGGVRRFMLPTMLVLPDADARARRPPGVSVQDTLGSTSASAAAARKNFDADELTNMFIDVINERATTLSGLAAGLAEGCSTGTMDAATAFQNGRIAPPKAITRPTSEHLTASTASSAPDCRALDLVGGAVGGAGISLPIHKALLKQPRPDGPKISGQSLSATPHPTTPPPEIPVTMSSKKRSSSSSSSASSSASATVDPKKANKSSVASSVVPPTVESENSVTLKTLISAAKADMPALTTGLLSTAVAEKALVGVVTEGKELHPAINVARRLEGILRDATRTDDLVNSIHDILTKPDGGFDAAIISGMKKQTMWDMLMTHGQCTLAVAKAITPFVAAALLLFVNRDLGKKIDDQLGTMLTNTALAPIQELQAKLDDAQKATADADARVHKANKEKDDETDALKTRIAELEARNAELEKELEEAKAAVPKEESADMGAVVEDEWDS